MKKILIIIVQTLFSMFCFSQTNIPSGEVNGIWSKSGSPYNINGNISLTSGTLNIEAGVDINFQGNYSFTISGLGNVIAKGTKINAIKFSATSSWNGLRFQNMGATTDSSIFEFCTFTRSKKIYNSTEVPGVANRDGGAIYINTFGKIRFENCTITNNVCSATSSSFNSGYSNGGGVFLLNAAVKIINCEISSNSASFSMGSYGGGLYLENSNAQIINCNISNNSASSGYYTGGGGLFLTNSNALILNCNIINNLSSAPNSTGTSSLGGGLYVNNSTSLNITNCNIVSNSTGYSPMSNGGGIYLANSINIYNSILWDNLSYGSLSQIYGTAKLYNCCLNESQIYLTRIKCISGNPLFVNATNSIYKLQSTSPCINAGENSYVITSTDYYGNPRIFGSSVDIGSYEFVTYTIIFKDWDGTKLNQQTVNPGSSAVAPTNPTRIGYSFTGWDTNFTNITSNITVTAVYSPLTNVNTTSGHTYKCYPNPVENKLYVEIPSSNKLLTIIITNIFGSIIYSQSTMGNTTLELHLSNLPKGPYLLNMSDDSGKIFEEKIIKL